MKKKRYSIKSRMLRWEKRAFLDGASIIVGVDEAGRGPLAGPVVAAAVTLNPSPLKQILFPFFKERIDDSKKLVPIQREKAFLEISKNAVFGVGLRSHNFIDRRNILNATHLAMRDAVRDLIYKFCSLNNKQEKDIEDDVCVLVDGNLDPGLPYKTLTILEGDSKSFSIAAASIVAKVWRDRIMVKYDKRYPSYGFSRHKGYGTRFHFEMLKKFGPCLIHRKSFTLVKDDDF